MALSKYKLGDLIEQRREKNNNYDVPIRGVSREGFIDAKQKDADTSLYNVFYKYDFVFNPARMEINSIALNTQLEKAICLSDILLPEYLNLFVKRDEFARQCEFIGWGSAREYCRVSELSNIAILLPDIDVQQKYVDIYNAMLDNQKAYESGLDDMKFVCDAFIENLKNVSETEAIGKYLIQNDERNTLGLGVESVRGLAVTKEMISTKADMTGVELSNYKVVHPYSIAYVPDTSRRGDKMSLGFNNSNEPVLVSSISIVFGTKSNKLLPQYLMLFFSRSEFDRYARFNSWGSARETFSWEDMCEVEIPIPDIKVQESIVGIYNAYITRREINEKLKAQLKQICPILIKGSLEEFYEKCNI